MPLNIQMFPPAVIELNKEITLHPKLQEILSMPENSNIDAETRISIVAACCQLVLHGDYSQKDIVEICDICLQKLRSMRTELIILSTPEMPQ